MASGRWKMHNQSKLWLADGTFDLDDNTNWNCIILLSTSNIDDLTLASPIYGNLTNEVATAFGYTAGGTAVTPTWTKSTSTSTYDASDAAWPASGGSITGRFGAIIKNATVNTIVKPVLCYCLLDTTPADRTATTGQTFTIGMNVSGLFNLTGMTSD